MRRCLLNFTSNFLYEKVHHNQSILSLHPEPPLLWLGGITARMHFFQLVFMSILRLHSDWFHNRVSNRRFGLCLFCFQSCWLPLFELRFIHFSGTRLLLLIQVLHNDFSPALPRGPSIFVFPRSRVAFSFHPSKSQSLRLRRMFMLS